MDFDLKLFLFLILHEKQSSMSPLEYSSQGKTENSHLLSIQYACIIDHYIYAASFNQDSSPFKLLVVSWFYSTAKDTEAQWGQGTYWRQSSLE